jgi:hypothetical protein
VNATLEATLSCAGRGWDVLPLHSIINGRCTCGSPDCDSPGKHPRTLHGVRDATTDEATIRRWWQRWPDANIGIATGAGSGFFVLDVDPRHDADDSLADLERTHGPLPDTVESLTGSGGRHVLFRHPGDHVPNKVGIAPGLDIRGDGGYIVAPPSLHLSGRRYAWEVSRRPDHVPLAAAPGWLLDLITAPRDRLPRDGTPLLISKGARNWTLYRLGCLLRRYGLCDTALEESLRAINGHHCRPQLSESEVRDIARSAARHPAGTFPEMSEGVSHITVEVL